MLPLPFNSTAVEHSQEDFPMVERKEYEAPRLQTYGKLEELTKGAGTGSGDTTNALKPQ
jgi:hypothetical protein